MSTTEELIEATVNKDGTANVNIQGTTHEFTATTEAAAPPGTNRGTGQQARHTMRYVCARSDA